MNGPAADPGHRIHELLEPVLVAVERLEHRVARVLDLVLWLAGLQGLREVAPEPVKPGVRHFEDAADVGAARLVEKDSSGLVVAVLRVAAFSLPIQQAECNQGIGESAGSPPSAG